MSMSTLEDAFIALLKDLLSAEKQLTKALPKMAKAADSDQLRQAFEGHLGETERHIERLEKVFKAIDRSPRSEKCEAMAGLIEEGEELVKEHKEANAARDAMIIAAAQKVEHYEISSYGTACTWARALGHNEALNLLEETMSEETDADEKLTQIAESAVNRKAAA